MTAGDLPALRRLTRAIREAELAALRAATTRADDAVGALEALECRKAGVLAGPPNDEAVYGADPAAWLGWSHRRQAELTAALARALADREQHRKRAERAFGRDEAVAALIRRQTAEARQRAQRRKAQGGNQVMSPHRL